MATITLRSPTSRACGFVRRNGNLATRSSTAIGRNFERGALTQTNVRQWQGCRTWPDCGDRVSPGFTCSTVTVATVTSAVIGPNTLVTVTFTRLRKLVSYTVDNGDPLTDATPGIGSTSMSFILNMGLTIGTNTLRVAVQSPSGGCDQLFQFAVNGGSVTPQPPT